MTQFENVKQGDLIKSVVVDDEFRRVIEVVENESGRVFEPVKTLYLREGEIVRVRHQTYLDVVTNGRVKYSVLAKEEE